MKDFLYTIFAFLPFMVCLVWLVIYAVEFRDTSPAKRFLTFFVGVCMVLYLCHAWFFMNGRHDFGASDAIYLFCNLSVFPLFLCYLKVLTKDRRFGLKEAATLLPAILLSAATAATGGEEFLLSAAKIVFILEVALTGVIGFRYLKDFDTEVNNYYSDTEDKVLKSTSVLLAFFIATSFLSAGAALVGRAAFHESILLLIPSLAFSTMLFSIFYSSFKIRFCARDFLMEMREDDASVPASSPHTEDIQLEKKIAEVMEEQKLYLHPGLKISDLAAAIGSNRTYISNAINRVSGKSFADYVNERRVEYAKQRMLEQGAEEVKDLISDIASDAGFASFPSFYRAFIKFTGKSPSSWLKDSGE